MTQVAIIGAGLAGLSCALSLEAEGLSVTLLEASDAPGGRVRTDLVFNADVRSGNYTIETDHGSVYLLGSARSQGELDKATQLARYVPGVQRVVSYVQVRYGEPNTAQASPPPMNYGGTNQSYVPPSAPPSSNAPIQVQKLN